MADKAEAVRREKRQARVGKAVWGVLLIVMGALFFLDELGRIDLKDQGRHPGGHAVDGNTGTRWSSEFSDPQWLAVDLGAKADLSRVRLVWEGAYAKEYEIQVSDDGERWTTAKDVSDGQGGVEEHDLTASGRYVRIYGTRRSTPWGYSLWELEVYGNVGRSAPHLLSQGMTTTVSSREGASYWKLYWPVLLIGAGLPALLAPKDSGDQTVGLILFGAGVFLQLERLALVDWRFSEIWPILLVAAGLLLVVQAIRQMSESSSGGSAVGGSGSKGEPS
jgi:hypothetical protein